MSSGNRSNWGQKNWDRKQYGGRGRGGFGGRDRGSRGGVHKSYRGHSFGESRGFRGGRQNDYGGRGGWKRNDMPGKRLSEEEIGVTEYINSHEGFSGVIKSRYSDFQVSEINLEGKIAKLTNTTPPEPPAEEGVEQDEDLLLDKYNVELLPMDVWDRINKLAVSEASDEKVEVDVDGMTKEQRTKIHDGVKKAFGDSIVSSTVNVDGVKTVRFERYRKGVRIDNRVKWPWGPEYVHFVVHKENCDTMDAAQRIAERIHINLRPSFLGYAGTKDRRAKTSQWFSAKRIDPRRLAAAAAALRDIHVGDFSLQHHQLKLGMLKGNRFRIALRNVTADEASVDAACRLLQDNGFVNYYGLQRFGTRADTPTYEIGRSLLKCEFQEAIDGILRPRPGPLEYPLQQYQQHGASAALAAGIRSHNSIELRLLKALHNQPKDLLGALNKLARNTRLLYMHSYQSLVWNRAASARLRRLGRRAAVGDLVPLGDTVHDDIEDESDTEDNTDTPDNDETQNGGDTATETEQPDKGNFDKVPVKFPVKILTQEDIDSGQYSIFDVILPLPGYFIDYPPNMVDVYEELLKKDGLTLELKNKNKSLSMSGAYRRLVTRPVDMSWSWARYDDPAADLILSDLDEMRGVELKDTPDGQYKALLVVVSLPASCYATMALRELLKVDTAGDYQALRNNYHKSKTEGTGGESSENPKDTSNDDEAGADEPATKRKLADSDDDPKRAKLQT